MSLETRKVSTESMVGVSVIVGLLLVGAILKIPAIQRLLGIDEETLKKQNELRARRDKEMNEAVDQYVKRPVGTLQEELEIAIKLNVLKHDYIVKDTSYSLGNTTAPGQAGVLLKGLGNSRYPIMIFDNPEISGGGWITTAFSWLSMQNNIKEVVAKVHGLDKYKSNNRDFIEKEATKIYNLSMPIWKTRDIILVLGYTTDENDIILANRRGDLFIQMMGYGGKPIISPFDPAQFFFEKNQIRERAIAYELWDKKILKPNRVYGTESLIATTNDDSDILSDLDKKIAISKEGIYTPNRFNFRERFDSNGQPIEGDWDKEKAEREEEKKEKERRKKEKERDMRISREELDNEQITETSLIPKDDSPEEKKMTFDDIKDTPEEAEEIKEEFKEVVEEQEAEESTDTDDSTEDTSTDESDDSSDESDSSSEEDPLDEAGDQLDELKDKDEESKDKDKDKDSKTETTETSSTSTSTDSSGTTTTTTSSSSTSTENYSIESNNPKFKIQEDDSFFTKLKKIAGTHYLSFRRSYNNIALIPAGYFVIDPAGDRLAWADYKKLNSKGAIEKVIKTHLDTLEKGKSLKLDKADGSLISDIFKYTTHIPVGSKEEWDELLDRAKKLQKEFKDKVKDKSLDENAKRDVKISNGFLLSFIALAQMIKVYFFGIRAYKDKAFEMYLDAKEYLDIMMHSKSLSKQSLEEIDNFILLASKSSLVEHSMEDYGHSENSLSRLTKVFNIREALEEGIDKDTLVNRGKDLGSKLMDFIDRAGHPAYNQEAAIPGELFRVGKLHYWIDPSMSKDFGSLERRVSEVLEMIQSDKEIDWVETHDRDIIARGIVFKISSRKVWSEIKDDAYEALEFFNSKYPDDTVSHYKRNDTDKYNELIRRKKMLSHILTLIRKLPRLGLKDIDEED